MQFNDCTKIKILSPVSPWSDCYSCHSVPTWLFLFVLYAVISIIDNIVYLHIASHYVSQISFTLNTTNQSHRLQMLTLFIGLYQICVYWCFIYYMSVFFNMDTEVSSYLEALTK